MVFLSIAVAVFCIIHLIPAVPSIKQRLQDKLGPAYGPSFGIVATLSLILIFVAWSFGQTEVIYEPMKAGKHINLAMSFIAFMFLGMFFFRGKARQFVRYPFAIAILFWAIGHLIANGDLASIIVFGGLLTYAILFIILSLANKVFPSLDVRDGHDVLAIIFGLAAYIAMVQMHEMLIGVPVLTIEQFFPG